MSHLISRTGEITESSEGLMIREGASVQIAQMELVQLIGMVRMSPRDEAKASAQLSGDVLRSVESAEECSFTRRMGYGDDATVVTGPTVRFAESVMRAWGRSRISTEVVDIDDRFVTSEGRFLDLETMLSVSRQVKRSIVKKNGNTYGPDMIAVASNAACSVSLRNVILYGGVPSSFWQPVYNKARDLVRSHVCGDLAEKFKEVVLHFKNEFNVTEAAILNYLDRQNAAEVKVSDVVELRDLFKALRDKNDETMTVESVFGSFATGARGPKSGSKPGANGSAPKAPAASKNGAPAAKGAAADVAATKKPEATVGDARGPVKPEATAEAGHEVSGDAAESATESGPVVETVDIDVVPDESPSPEKKRLVLTRASEMYRDGGLTTDRFAEMIENGEVFSESTLGLQWCRDLFQCSSMDSVRVLGKRLSDWVNSKEVDRELAEKTLRPMIMRLKTEF